VIGFHLFTARRIVASGVKAHGGGLPVKVGVCFFVGVAVTVSMVFVPFLLIAPESFIFGLLEYHAAREVGGISKMLAYKAGFVSRLCGAYFVGVGLTVVLLISGLARIMRRSGRLWLSGAPGLTHRFGGVIWCSVAAVTLLHLSAPFPYDDYQVIVYPLFSAALAASAVAVIRRIAASLSPSEGGAAGCEIMVGKSAILFACVSAALVCLTVVDAFSSEVSQKWFVGKRKLIWWPLKQKSSVAILQDAGKLVGDLSSGKELLTQDTYLAVEAGLSVPAGMELGPFCYFPDMTEDKARACHVMNRDMMLNLLSATEAPVLALSEYGFAIQSPEVVELSNHDRESLTRLLNDRYRLFRTIEDFGQAATDLRIYLLEE